VQQTYQQRKSSGPSPADKTRAAPPVAATATSAGHF